MSENICVKILGDYGPFSREGRCISYEIEVCGDNYLIDCGAPLFKQLGGHHLKEVKGLFITHCHDDHKRWFTDLAIFHRYAKDVFHKLALYTTESLNDELKKSSSAALANTLSDCRKKVVGVKYDEYVDFRTLGPRPLYRIISQNEGDGHKQLYIVNLKNEIVGPEQAKIVINPDTGRSRMLFHDLHSGVWVDPELYYTFSDTSFYEKDQNILTDKKDYTIEAIKAPVWHGIIGIGLKISCAGETLVFSSDTVNDTELWQDLYQEKRKPIFTDLTLAEFTTARVIYGDINNYIERVWSQARYNEAITSFVDAAVIHDVSVYNSIVHTDYETLGNTRLDKNRTILVHSPDRMTSEWILSAADKEFVVKNNLFMEKVGDQLFPLNADIYHREEGRYFVGYKNEQGKYTVYEKDGLLSLSNAYNFNGKPYFKIDLYEDIGGRYYKKLEDENSFYEIRADGGVELIHRTETGSRGTLLQKDEREKLAARKNQGILL